MRMHQDAETAQRFSWQFDYAAEKVLAAAQDRVRHHNERLKWWEKELKQAENDLKQKGFEYRDRGYTGGEEIVIVGDPELAKRAATCRDKIASHRQLIENYEAWVRALSARPPGSLLQLSIADIRFFGL